jgi:hypothetical protein
MLPGWSIAAKPDTAQRISFAAGITVVIFEFGLVWIQNWQAFRVDRDLLIVYLVFMPATLDGVMSA